MYHPGKAIFHEGMKYWSCCNRKTSNFTAFLEQPGCTKGIHQWSNVSERVFFAHDKKFLIESTS